MSGDAAICWFCGIRRNEEMQIGADMRVMLCSSYILHQPNGRETRSDGGIPIDPYYWKCRICRDCLSERYSEIETISDDEREFHERRARRHITQMCNYETGLIGQSDRTRRFGCWFCYYPYSREARRYQSLSMAQLFDAGLRLNGTFRCNNTDLVAFLDHFGNPMAEGMSSRGCLSHFASAFAGTGDEDIDRLCTVRACIYDLSVDTLMRATVVS